jgi:hypothetical protein
MEVKHTLILLVMLCIYGEVNFMNCKADLPVKADRRIPKSSSSVSEKHILISLKYTIQQSQMMD